MAVPLIQQVGSPLSLRIETRLEGSEPTGVMNWRRAIAFSHGSSIFRRYMKRCEASLQNRVKEMNYAQ
jgi:hypothetical protein